MIIRSVTGFRFIINLSFQLPTLLICLFGCKHAFKSEWKTYDANAFSFQLPPKFQIIGADSLDSNTENFRHPRIDLSFDYYIWANYHSEKGDIDENNRTPGELVVIDVA